VGDRFYRLAANDSGSSSRARTLAPPRGFNRTQSPTVTAKAILVSCRVAGDDGSNDVTQQLTDGALIYQS
jgi:hypothetical protein